MSKEIKDFAITHLTIGATCDFHTMVEDEIKVSTPEALHLETENPPYVQDIGALQSVVNRKTAFAATEILEERDDRRDRAAGLIINVVKAYASSTIEAKRAAAAKLKAELAPYVGIGKHQYAKQTSELRGMLATLAEPENAAAITALHLDEEVEELQAANDAFVEAMKGKFTESTARDPQREADSKELCDRLNAQYARIVKTVNAYAFVQPTDEINDFIDRVNGIVATYAAMVDGSATGDETKPTDPTEGEEGEGGEEGKDDEGTDLPFEPTDPNPDEGGEEEETPSVV